jgi:hypothetical protein
MTDEERCLLKVIYDMRLDGVICKVLEAEDDLYGH